MSAPRNYRLLTDGDIIERGDQPLLDDCESWGELSGWEIGMRYKQSVLVPMRRDHRQAGRQPNGRGALMANYDVGIARHGIKCECGGMPVVWTDTGTTDFWIECDACELCGPGEDSVYNAIASWNRGDRAEYGDDD